MTTAKVDAASLPATIATDEQDVWHLSAVIPRRDVTDAAPLNYRISASDGYTSDTTPTYPVVISDKGLASVGGHAYSQNGAAVGVDLAGLTVRATAVINGSATAAVIADDTTDSDGRYTISDLPSGQYDITVDPTGLPPHSDPSAPTLTHRVTLNLGQRIRDSDFQINTLDS
jgi:hypothetical protein